MATALDTIKQLLNAQYGMLTSRCNMALFLALTIVKEQGRTLNLADQGGWMTYQKYANILSIPVEIIKTENGVLPTDRPYDALICCEPAGYLFGQDVAALRDCTQFLILDVCGSIGRSYLSGILKNWLPDIIVCSFSTWKPVNLGYGGFLGCADAQVWGRLKKLSSLERVRSEFLEEALPKRFALLGKQYATWDEQCKQIKQKFPQALYDEGKGICIAVPFETEQEKAQITQYAEQEGFETTLLPREIRLSRQAVCFEVKRKEFNKHP